MRKPKTSLDATYEEPSPHRLRDALEAVEKLRDQEEAARKEAEALAAGLQVLVDAETVEQMLEGILDVLSEMVPFTDATIIIEDNNLLYSASTTSPDVFFQAVKPITLFENVLNGTSAVIPSLARVTEWQNLELQVTAAYQSALLVPLAGHKTRGLIFCAHTAESWFTEKHLLVLEKFASLAANALQKEEKRKELEQLVGRLDHLARHDPLTGLTNLTAFKASLARSFRDANRAERMVAILMVDLDDFKTVNDTLGHSAGDFLLCEVAQRMSSTLRGGDVVARIGGDEFAIMIPGLRELEAGRAVAHKILNELSKPIFYHGQKIYPAASIGIAAYPVHGVGAESVLKQADVAMYHAKTGGKNTVHLFSEVLQTEVDRRHSLETLIRRSLGTSDFCLYYQPIMRLGDNVVVGMEALLRWNHPERGIVAPGSFLDVAIQTRLIVPIGDWVIETACAELAGWLREGGRRVAVNVALPQILATDFVEKIRQTIALLNVPARAVELELSEDIIANKVTDNAFAGLRILDSIGVQFAFDDFGTGSSSIAHLRRFPGKRLKIDRGFVANMLSDSKDMALVRGIITLAHSLGLTVVAEGVETDEQLSFLRAEGCDEAQGFLIGSPKPLNEALNCIEPAVQAANGPGHGLAITSRLA